MCKIRILFEPAIIQFTLFLSVIQPLYGKMYHVVYANQTLKGTDFYRKAQCFHRKPADHGCIFYSPDLRV